MNTSILRSVLAVSAALTLSFGACAKPVSSDTPRPGDRPAVTKRSVDDRDSYVIKFDRPLSVGLRYKVAAQGRVDSSTVINGQPVAAQAVQMTYAYEAVITVKGLHASGKPTKLEAKIVKLQWTKLGATTDLLPKDTLVLAETAGTKERFSVNGKPVSKDAAKVLGYVISLYDGDTSTTDDVFAPDGPKKPGDTWKPNAAKLLAGFRHKFKKGGLMPKPSEITGEVTFVGVKKVNGMDVLEMKVQVKIPNIAPPLGPVKLTAGSMEIGMSGWLPKDPNVVAHDLHGMSIKMHIEGEIVKGSSVIQVVVDYDQSEKKTTSPVH